MQPLLGPNQQKEKKKKPPKPKTAQPPRRVSAIVALGPRSPQPRVNASMPRCLVPGARPTPLWPCFFQCLALPADQPTRPRPPATPLKKHLGYQHAQMWSHFARRRPVRPMVLAQRAPRRSFFVQDDQTPTATTRRKEPQLTSNQRNWLGRVSSFPPIPFVTPLAALEFCPFFCSRLFSHPTPTIVTPHKKPWLIILTGEVVEDSALNPMGPLPKPGAKKGHKFSY